MTWKIVQACSVGTSHLAAGQGCQDECLAIDCPSADGSESILLAAVADGAGSASHSAEGSNLAVTITVKVLERSIEKLRSMDFSAQDLVAEIVSEVRQAIVAAADEKDLSMRDFACTLLGCAVWSKAAMFFQVGDGAIVTKQGEAYQAVFWPASGEYVNATNFITGDSWIEDLEVSVIEGKFDAFALLSDGLQRLALTFLDKSVHAPFFNPMIDKVQATPRAELDGLSESLRQFLASPAINSRTDDDKTLILAVRERDESSSGL